MPQGKPAGYFGPIESRKENLRKLKPQSVKKTSPTGEKGKAFIPRSSQAYPLQTDSLK
jgi:hypothetical protein